jgi:hypothetical protein
MPEERECRRVAVIRAGTVGMAAASAAEQAGPRAGSFTGGADASCCPSAASTGVYPAADGSWLKITEHLDFRTAEPAA